jgi:single-strand DNA-binding protein
LINCDLRRSSRRRATSISIQQRRIGHVIVQQDHHRRISGTRPEIRYTAQGTAVCNISVATTELRKNAAGKYDDHTTWFRVTVWNRQAELVNEYLAKGRQVYIEGRLRQEEYTDREGNTRTSLEVTATDIQFLRRREDSAQPTSGNAGRAQAEEAEEVATPAPNGSGKSGRKGSKRTAKETINVEAHADADGEIQF